VVPLLAYPGWNAHAGEDVLPIFPVNVLQSGVVLPEKSGRVRFVFDPPLLELGEKLAFASLLIWMILALASLVIRLRQKRLR
jgi:uncharacterized membrane protein YfhO